MMLSEIQKPNNEPPTDVPSATEHDIRSLCLAIQECKNLDRLTTIVMKGLSDLYGSSEISWLEIEKAGGRILWSQVYSASGAPSRHDELGAAREIDSLNRIIEKYCAQKCDDIILLSEIVSQSELVRTAYFQLGMKPEGLDETINLQVYHSESGAAVIMMGMKKQGFTPEDRKNLAYIRDHVRIASQKIARMRSCSNLIKSLEKTRKTKSITGVSVLSGDGSKLWDVDTTSEMILSRTGLGGRATGGWILKDELRNWVAEIMSSHSRIFPRQEAYVQSFGLKGDELQVSVYLERAGAGGLLVFSSKDSPHPRLNKENNAIFTRRESEIATLMLADESSQEISEALNISKRTVEKHLENIYIKLQVKNRLAAIKKLRVAN